MIDPSSSKRVYPTAPVGGVMFLLNSYRNIKFVVMAHFYESFVVKGEVSFRDFSAVDQCLQNKGFVCLGQFCG